MKNEAKRDDMVDIMTHIHQYVPSIPLTRQIKLTAGECVDNMGRILMGCDQMTAARRRSAINAKANAETPSKRLEGLISTLHGRLAC